jgi:hypothetical protein
MYTIVVIFLIIMAFIAIFWRNKKSKDLEKICASWFQELITRFQERFPDQPFHVDERDPINIVVPPKHSAVGELRIYDLGTRITVEINPFLHQDFDFGEGNLDDGRDVVDVLLFLEEIFEDKREFYGRPNACSDQERGKKPRSFLNKLLFGKTTYVWSGPIEQQ